MDYITSTIYVDDNGSKVLCNISNTLLAPVLAFLMAPVKGPLARPRPVGIAVSNGKAAVTVQFMGGNKWKFSWRGNNGVVYQQFRYSTDCYTVERVLLGILTERTVGLTITKLPKFASVNVM